MRGFWKLALTELKLYIREPDRLLLHLRLPHACCCSCSAASTATSPTPSSEAGASSTSALRPTLAMIIGTTGLMSLAISVATHREQGVLRRYKATPLGPLAYLGAQVITLYLMTAGGMVLLIVFGQIFYHLRFAGNALNVWAGFTLSCAAFFALGFVLAGSCRRPARPRWRP